MFLFVADDDKNDFYGKYHLCTGGNSKRIGLNITLTEDNKFYYRNQTIDAFYNSFSFSGHYEINNDTIELKIERVVQQSGHSSAHIKEFGEYIASTDVYIPENKRKDRRKDRKTHFGDYSEKNVGKLEYHDIKEMNERYFKCEFYWNWKLFITEDDEGFRLDPLESNWHRNGLFLRSFCKKE